jgi:phage anti-repressor protein
LYSDFSVMSNVLEGMAAEDGFVHRTDRSLEETIKKRFRVNGVRHFDIKENIKINRTNNGVELVMDYEVRMDLIRNIDMIASFDKTVELRR